jgi:outer membrane protein OmpA-like peptidoglycan-associated protein
LALGALGGVIAIFVESALAFFAVFMIGACAASLIRQRSVAAHEAWALGLVPAALLWLGATLVAQPAYQARLQKRVVEIAQAAGVDPAGLALSGRDVVATPAVVEEKALATRIAAIPGVRRVIASVEPAPAPRASAERPDETSSIAPAPQLPPTSDRASDPQSILAALPAGELDAETCQRALDAIATLEPVAFRVARATVDRRASRALDKAAEVIRRCPDATIEVRGHGDEGKEEDTLSRRRALAAQRYLRREGVAGRRLVAVGCCAPAEQERRIGAIEYIVR